MLWNRGECVSKNSSFSRSISVARGGEYLRRLAQDKMPPREDAFGEIDDLWRSHRDEKPFVNLWWVDLTRLLEGGSERLLAWERSSKKNGAY